jgi:hypothetical protein
MADGLPRSVGEAGHRVRDGGRKCHDVAEERVLRPVEPDDEGGVDPGLGRDPAQRRAVIAELGELTARCLGDRLTRRRGAWPASASLRADLV